MGEENQQKKAHETNAEGRDADTTIRDDMSFRVSHTDVTAGWITSIKEVEEDTLWVIV